MNAMHCIDTFPPQTARMASTLELSAGTMPSLEGLTWRQWMHLGLVKAMGQIVGLFDRLATWQDRARQRHHLEALDDRMLRDIGISPVEVWQEAHKPFWRD